METIKGKRTVKVEVEVTTYRFEASCGDYYEDLTIEDGEIQEIGCWDSRNGGSCKKGEPGFVTNCYSTIRFIAKYKPEELKNIYNVLSDAVMKDFCKKLQREKMAELKF